MKPITPKQYEQIKDAFPVQQGNVEIENIVASKRYCTSPKTAVRGGNCPRNSVFGTPFTQGCDAGPKTASGRESFEALQTKLNITVEVTAPSLDSTSVKVHPDGTGAL